MKYRLARVSTEEATERLLKNERGGLGAAVLGPAEQEVFASLKMPKRRLDWLAGRLAVKRLALAILAERGEKAEASEVEVHNREDGSPFLALRAKPIADIPISLSHGPLGAAAATAGPGRLIGVDVETISERPDSFVSIFAHPSERVPEFSSPEGLMRLWTLKEAVLKLLSLGLSVDLWDVRFSSGESGSPEFHGRALTRWEALGRPEIRCETLVSAADILSVAFSIASSPVPVRASIAAPGGVHA